MAKMPRIAPETVPISSHVSLPAVWRAMSHAASSTHYPMRRYLTPVSPGVGVPSGREWGISLPRCAPCLFIRLPCTGAFRAHPTRHGRHRSWPRHLVSRPAADCPVPSVRLIDYVLCHRAYSGDHPIAQSGGYRLGCADVQTLAQATTRAVVDRRIRGTRRDPDRVLVGRLCCHSRDLPALGFRDPEHADGP